MPPTIHATTLSCPPLVQYYSSARDDNFLVGADVHRHDAEGADYVAVRVEGFQALQPAPPPTSGPVHVLILCVA